MFKNFERASKFSALKLNFVAKSYNEQRPKRRHHVGERLPSSARATSLQLRSSSREAGSEFLECKCKSKTNGEEELGDTGVC